MKKTLTVLIFLSISLVSVTAFAIEPVLDCSPRRTSGFNPVQEKIYIRADGAVAQYEFSQAGLYGDEYKVALLPGERTVRRSPEADATSISDGIFVGMAPNGDSLQLVFSSQEGTVIFSRNPDAADSVYPCRIEKRVEVEWVN